VLNANLTDEADQVAAPLTSENDVVGPSVKPTITDWARVSLAGALILVLAVLTIGTGWFVAAYPSKEAAIVSFLKLVYTPIVGLVGSVIGFYFGAHAASGSSSNPSSGK
jgi:hypothetical protein